MPIEVQFNDTNKINKPFWKVMLEGVYIGKLLNIKAREHYVIPTAIDILKYSFSQQVLQNLKESEIRFVRNYCHIRGKLCSFWQVQFPYLSNLSEIEQINKYIEYSELIENIRNIRDLDIFYFDREENIGDYNYYLDQLDEKRELITHYSSEDGRQFSNFLRNSLPEAIMEMSNHFKTRTRECFFILSADCKGETLEDIENAIIVLDKKVKLITTSLSEIGVQIIEVENEHRDWLFVNFISHTAQY